MSSRELFTMEYDILLAARGVASSQDMPADFYRDTLLALTEHYQRLVRESQRLISRSDRAERELNRLNSQLHQLTVALEYKATHDPLTDVYNRGAIIDRIGRALEQGRAALILLDIDHFKQINDSYGHPTGDAVICALIARIRQLVQDRGHIGRIGGEEFTILLAGGGLTQAVELAQTIHASLNETPLSPLPQRRVTVSFGISAAGGQSNFSVLYQAADAALYEAKRQGRNRLIAR
ncbi:GGDEF domain-containing protein [Affinibrenneria salicis]|uniref:diguanylate cyclase n=1 Tax=Affinibrenneria salicis TaxID=2590031 RepID=A0A5J5FTK4_9GAMM|nr:GGDEF domain-containing protein [Affinibrenneria salicis]KAA8996165.1 GGDEF domain-containing protein [Affinibrenneria salicis]